MTYERFEDLPVWQKAAELYELSEALLENDAFRVTRAFRDQLGRAALSVSNNIAEGFERGTTKELLQFIYIARGSAGEVRSMLTQDLKSEISALITTAESCSRQLRGWADKLQNSEIRGPRYITQKSRQQGEERKRAEQFQKQLLRMLPAENPLRKDAEARGLI